MNEAPVILAFSVKTESAALDRNPLQGVEVWHLGMGAERALVNFERRRLQRKRIPACFISAGFAGGLDPALQTGQLLRPHSVQTTSGAPIRIAAEGNICLLTTDRIIATAADKARHFERSQCGAVDMETWHLARRCAELGWRFASVRVVSDEACMDLPKAIVRHISNDGRIRHAGLIGHLLRTPQEIPEFVRFVTQANHAAKTLAKELRTIVPGSNQTPAGMIPEAHS